MTCDHAVRARFVELLQFDRSIGRREHELVDAVHAAVHRGKPIAADFQVDPPRQIGHPRPAVRRQLSGGVREPHRRNAASKIYAVEGSCFVIAPCATVSQSMIEELCDTPEKYQFLHVGGGFAVIYGPDSAPLAQPLPPDKEGLVYADIDLGMISVAKAAADPAGHYVRPDVTRLLFNNRPANRVETLALPVDAEPTADAMAKPETEASNVTTFAPPQATE